MGEVFRARDPRLNREVAIKIIAADIAADPQALARFEREARAVARLSHPGSSRPPSLSALTNATANLPK